MAITYSRINLNFDSTVASSYYNASADVEYQFTHRISSAAFYTVPSGKVAKVNINTFELIMQTSIPHMFGNSGSLLVSRDGPGFIRKGPTAPNSGSSGAMGPGAELGWLENLPPYNYYWRFSEPVNVAWLSYFSSGPSRKYSHSRSLGISQAWNDYISYARDGRGYHSWTVWSITDSAASISSKLSSTVDTTPSYVITPSSSPNPPFFTKSFFYASSGDQFSLNLMNGLSFKWHSFAGGSISFVVRTTLNLDLLVVEEDAV